MVDGELLDGLRKSAFMKVPVAARTGHLEGAALDTLHVGKTVAAVSARQLEPLASWNIASNSSVHKLFPPAELVRNVTDAVPLACRPPRGQRTVR
jgi:hypothetical protein